MSSAMRRGLTRGGLQWRTYSTANEEPKLPPCDFKPQPYKGHSYGSAKEVQQKNVVPCLAPVYKEPLLLHQGYKQWLFDHNGKRYLDLFAGIATVSVGHCHPKVKDALVTQANSLWHTSNLFMHPKLHEYAQKLTAKLPDKLNVVYFVNSGSEANDLAMLLCRSYTKNYDIIALRNAYHGMSPYTAGLVGISVWKPDVPTGSGVYHTMNPDVFRGVWGGKYCRDSPVQTVRKCNCSPSCCEASSRYIDQLEEILQTSVHKKRVAGFFAESIQGVGGTVQYPKDYLKKAFKIIKDSGGLCVSDEVQTGFGRTGDHFWGFEGHDVQPDIVTMAKGIGNGFPLAAVVTTTEIAQSLKKFLHFNTFSGNPLACAVGTAVLEVIEEEKLQENCKIVGTYMLTKLAELRDKFDCIGDVRGKGLMIGVEMVKDKNQMKPMAASDFLDIWEEIKKHGIIIGKGGAQGNVFRIKPPMCITKEDVDYTISVLDKVLTKYVETQSTKN
ncbi:alanine--glyoxylate aminotransferase 2, mitochondrial-like isoform X2 [Schistocerca gregaria]|uniref:alanine--glyoxylate aminotransferase 2, mitochondrial-like isoform X2 n=1 Tax=Schistocerca gregaria TaxID=7010 RepID=UPI00211E214C|nr:alanine--glyoxylate aminotransferase 2, mitochondrial-like isoform X2 [Schistocerca gregaria]